MSNVSTVSKPNLNWVEFGVYIKTTRTKLRMSQKEFARRIRKHQPDVVLIEKGDRQSTVETCFLIADALQISPATLFSKFQKTDE